MIRKIRLWDRLVSGGIIEEFGHKEVETEATTLTSPAIETLGALFDDVRDEPHVVPSQPLSETVRIQQCFVADVFYVHSQPNIPRLQKRVIGCSLAVASSTLSHVPSEPTQTPPTHM